MFNHLLTLAIISTTFLVGCESNQQSVSDNSMVKKKITLKNFVTGQKINPGLRQASIDSKSWSFFGQPRKVEVETLADGTVASIKFPLGSWYDGYQLKDSLKVKFKEEGAPEFSFKCSDEYDSIELAGNRFSVGKSICTANDGTQILEITDQHLRYEESFFKMNPYMKSIVDFSTLRLFDPNLLNKKDAEKSAAAAKLRDANLKKLEQESNRAKKDI